MNQERQKTDAIADAVEIPEGATHYRICNDGSIIYYKIDGRYVDVHIGFWTISAMTFDHPDLQPL